MVEQSLNGCLPNQSHYWKMESPYSPEEEIDVSITTSKGTCGNCGAARNFPNSLDKSIVIYARTFADALRPDKYCDSAYLAPKSAERVG